MAVQLFAHNRQAHDAVTAMLAAVGKATVIHPTGTGKSFIAFKWIEEHAGARFVWLSPSEYIYHTQIENVTRAAPDFPVESIAFLTYARLMMMTDEEISVLAPFGIILDEFHRCGAKCWGGGVARLLSVYPNAQLLGLSATKIRYLDGQRDMAEELFAGCVASEMTLGEAVVRGILPAPRYVTTVYQVQKELDGLQRRIDAVSPAALRRDSQRRMDALREAVEHAEGLLAVFARHMTQRTGKYLVFCANRAHMKRMLGHAQEWFGGIDPQMHIYSAYSADPQTSRAYKAFVQDDSEHLKLLFSINMLNEGVHVRGVSGVILFRETESPIIYKQQVGRALTTGTQSTPLILDVVNNFGSLSSYGTIQSEMDAAVQRLRREERDGEIVAEKLEVAEQVRDAAELFRQLESSLCTTWDFYYDAAASYYREYGNLKVQRRHVTQDGLQLGVWIQNQRSLYQSGNDRLSRGQIERLNQIGMFWEEHASLAWRAGYAHAKAYYMEHGDLRAPKDYICEDGYNLGTWLSRMRQQKNGSIKNTMLNEARIAQLEAIGMVWDVHEGRWEDGYRAACRYHAQHGNLNVPSTFVTDDGFALGHWIRAQRDAKKEQYGRKPLSEEQVCRLDALGMRWDTLYEARWREAFEAAKRYYEIHGNLSIPMGYETREGIRLGAWVQRQKQRWKNGKHNDSVQYEILSEIGMFAGKSPAD